MRVAAVLFVLALTRAIAGAAQAPARTVWDGVYSEEQKKRGEQLYTDQCQSCHGTALEGGEMAPPLAGGTFNSNWTGLTMGDLLERVRISMPASSPGSLSRQQCADILSYMLSVGGFPAGKADLPRETDVLKEIKFLAMKP